MSANQGTPETFAARWQKLNDIFAAAQELDPERQKDLLEHACGDDDALRKEAAAILAASRDAQSQKFLHADVFAAGARVLARDEIAGGTEIGDYRVIREIGRGGMGAVYLAERTGFHQQVALKIIKRGMDSDQIVRRFVRERDVLASLNHSNIARLLDGGHTTDGLPFIAMEYVEGETITAFCDQKRLAIEDRIELFRKVCRAVAYAHHNLVVHRDIKPSNIVVGADGEPKLLDFGIAKLLAPDVFDNTVDLTAAGGNLLTPDYASPEQIRGERVTTASDIYSLGVLLYELLSGHRPLRLKNRPSMEMLRIVSEQEPRAPSDAATMLTETPEDHTQQVLTVETVAQSRNERPARLQKRLRGDLDNIVLTALRKDPLRRYSSVEEFSADLERHLLGLPVVARPATLGYRVSKFVFRNKTATAFAVLALLALLTGLSIAIWQTQMAKQQKTRAEQSAAETRRLANSLLNEYDEELLNLPGSYPIRIRLAKASSEYLERLAKETDDPVVLRELAEAYSHLGNTFASHFANEAEARRHAQKAVELARRVLISAPNDPSAKELLAQILVAHGHEGSQRESNTREAVKLREDVAANNSNLETLNNLADTYLALGGLLRLADRREEALSYFTRALETRKRQLEMLDRAELTADEYSAKFWALAWTGLSQGEDFNNWQAATITLRQGLETAETAALKFPDHRRTQTNMGTAHSYLARALIHLRDYQAALQHHERALAFNRKAAVRFNLFWHGSQALHLLKIAELLQKTGETERSLVVLRDALALRREATAVNHADPSNKHKHAQVFLEAGKLFAVAEKPAEARAAYREAESVWEQLSEFAPHLPLAPLCRARVSMHLGDLLADCLPEEVNIKETNQSRLREAVKQYEEALQLYAANRKHLSEATKQEENLAQAKLAATTKKLNP